MNKTLSTLLLVLALIVGGFLIFTYGFNSGAGEAKEGEGRVFFSFTDAAADMEAVSEVHAEIDAVELYSETQGWVSVETDNEEYALLALRDANELQLYAEAIVDADTYTQMRVVFDKVTVTKTDGTTHAAALAATTVDLAATTRVESQKDSHVTIDILADKSLHSATDGTYVFAPALAVETRSNTTVTVDANSNVVVLAGGTTDDRVLVGTDVDGSVKSNFELPANTQIDVSLLGNVMSDSKKSDTNSNGSIKVDATVHGSADADGAMDKGSIDANLKSETGVEVR